MTSIAIEMLESGRVDAVVCVQSDENDRFTPKPVGESSLPVTTLRRSYVSSALRPLQTLRGVVTGKSAALACFVTSPRVFTGGRAV